MDLREVDRIIDGYDADKSWLVMILQDVQEAYHYLPADVLRHVGRRLGLSESHVYNVATFYGSFSLQPRGRFVIRVCDGTACHLRGSTFLRNEIVRLLGIVEGETTADGLFSLETVACLGACALAPVMTVGTAYHGQMTREKVHQTLDECRAAAAPQTTA